MDVDVSGARDASANKELTDTQTELLTLLQRFICLLTSDAIINTQIHTEFRAAMRKLRDKAPETARFLATTILEHSDVNNGSRDGTECQQQDSARLNDNAIQPTKRKSAPTKDLSYRPPRSAKAKTEKPNLREKSGQPENGSRLHTDSPTQGDIPDSVQPPVKVQEDTTPQAGNVELHEVKSSEVVNASGDDVSWLLDQQQSLAQDDSRGEDADKIEMVVAKEMKKEVQRVRATSVSDEAKEWRPASLESTEPTASMCQVSPDTVPATPTKQMEVVLPSPQTEEIHRGKIPRSLESVSTSPSVPMSSPSEVTSLRDTILEAVRTIHGFSKYQHGVPREIHSRILQTLKEDHKETVSGSNWNAWSDGSMWMRVLEAGESENQRVTIFNMLDYMGAWEWYDRQVGLSQTTVRTKNNKPVGRRGAAIHVLNEMQGQQTNTELPGKSIRGVGRLTLREEGDEPAISSKSCDFSVVERARDLQRKRISMQLSRGRRLKKLVRELGFGILFSPKIWEYTKMDTEHLDVMIKNIQADSKRMRLLHILGHQLELLINEGRPDLASLFASLQTETLVSEKEYGEFRAIFALEAEAIPQGSLNTAVDRLIEDVSSKVLGKRKRMLKPDDNVTLDGGVDIFCNTFDMLRHGKWLDNWMIMAGMQMSDKPFFVRYGYSVTLDRSERFGRSGTKRVSRPLAGWRNTIEKLRSEAQIQHVQGIRLVYFCPLNSNNNHFTLLEINEREKKIYHYNSMADQGVIDGTVKLTRVGKMVVEEFDYLNFEYIEAATPQQKDGSSCGLMVVRNAALRMNGFSVGGWHDVVDPERSRMEIVEAYQASISDNAMQRKGGPEKSSSNSEGSTWKDLEKGSRGLDGIGDKSKRRKLLKV